MIRRGFRTLMLAALAAWCSNNTRVSLDSSRSQTQHDFTVRPLASSSTKRAMLCTVAKDPERRYVDEWADYHAALGFAGVRIYDNTDEFALQGWGYDKSYADLIERIHFIPGVTHPIKKHEGCPSQVQSAAFLDCAYRFYV